MEGKITYRRILSVALPVMVGTFVQFTVSITDSAFLNRVSSTDFNASGNAGMLYIWLYMLAIGLSSGAQILIARREGENNKKEAGKLFDQTLITLFLFGLLCFVLLEFARMVILPHVVSSEAIGSKMQEYLSIRDFGFFPAVFLLAFQGFFSGIARTRVIMYYTLITAIGNVVLDYFLIFGKGGFPQMGIQGAALASVLSEIIAVVFILLYVRFQKGYSEYRLFRNLQPDTSVIWPLFRLSYPLMVQGFISTGAWTIFFFFIEQMGEDELEISQVIRMFYLIALIPVLGIGAATRTFVSQLMAMGRQQEIIPTVKKIMFLNFIATLIFTHPNFLYPETAVPWISQNTAILQETAFVLQMVTGAMFLLALTSPLINLISGAGDTQAAFRIELFSILIYLFCAYLVTIPFRQNIVWVWSLEYLYFLCMGIAALYIIKVGKWKEIRL